MTFVKINKQVPKSFNNLFDELLNEFPALPGKDWNAGAPPVNIAETADAYHLELSAPGRNKEDFKVNIENGLLTIGFEKKEETKDEAVKSVRKEFAFQSFKRSFSLDEKIDVDNIQAKYENGLLKFLLPKKEQVKETPKQISIQ
ncbi:MAG: Hsp20/alpha crystallin family protein [Chitinophagaceae bacterium]